MNKIYCRVTTKQDKVMAKLLKVSEPFVTNLVSTWQTVNNKPNTEPSLEELKTFMKANKKHLKEIELSVPVFETQISSTKSIKYVVEAPVVMESRNQSITLTLFPKDATAADLADHMDRKGLGKYKEYIRTFKDYYLFELYAMKLAINKNITPNAYYYEPYWDEYDQAVLMLQEYKKLHPEEGPTPPAVSNIRQTPKDSQQENQTTETEYKIKYTPKGKATQEYTVKGSHIYNKKGEEVFKQDSVDRNKIFANLAVAQKRAVVVKHKGKDYVVNNKGQIISVTSGKIMQWGPENRDRQDILKLAAKKSQTPGMSYTNYSGGANGSDSYWDEIGSQFGVSSTHFYGDDKTPKGNTKITEADREEGKRKATAAARAMYDFRGAEIKNSLVVRNWSQVKYADSVFAVGTIVQPGDKISDKEGDRRTATITQVKGGTGYAVQMAIAEGKPVYVFDQERGRWFKNIGGQWSESDVPVLTPRFAGIGTRNLQKNGKLAIEEVFAKTFGKPVQSKADEILNSESTEEEAFEEEETDNSDYELDPQDIPEIGTEVLDTEKEDPRAKLARDFTPMELTNRVENIARRFSEKVDEVLEELIESKKEEMAEASDYEKEVIKRAIKKLSDPIIGRRMAIEAVTFKELYDRLKDDFKEYAEVSEEDFEEEYGEGKGHIIKDKYQKILDNFEALFEDACILIENAENVRIIMRKEEYNDGFNTEEEISATIQDSTTDAYNENEEFGDDDEGERTTGNEGWSFKVRHVDPYTSLSAEVKRALHDIQRTSYNGDPILDDLGNTRYITAEYAHAVLIDKLSNMIDADDFSVYDDEGNISFPALEEISKRIPWVNQVINKLEEDPRLVSLFFADFRKDFIPYWKQRLKDGTVQSFTLNKENALYSTMKEVTTNYEHGNTLDEYSIYDSKGSVNKENASKGSDMMEEALDSFQELEDEEDFQKLTDTVNKGLRMLGFDINPSTVLEILESESGEGTLEDMVRTMSDIFESALSLEDDLHLISELQEQYTRIARVIGEVSELHNVSAFRIGDKSYYSYSAPNYINTMFKILKNDKRRQDYLDSQFKSYDWFYDSKEKKWKSKWLELIESDPDVLDKLELKEINDIDGTPYTEWAPDQLKSAFVMEYFSVGENTGSKKQFAWYNFPIFSDSPVAMFVKFLRYTDNFKEELLPLFNSVVRQELYRIEHVRKRAEKGVSKIQNYDKSGNRFNFFPELNSVRVGDKSFLEAIEDMKKEGDLEGIEDLINDTLTDVMDNLFTDFIDELGELQNEEGTAILDLLVSQGIAATPEGAMDKLEEYFWNQTFASSQIIQMVTTDLAFYKDGTDFQKRFKEGYAAGTKLNTNSKYGRKTQHTIYLADQTVTSAKYFDIKGNLMEAYKQNRLSKMDVDSILYKFRNINAVDAQAYRSMSSYRAVLDMMGLWTEEMEAAIDRFEHDEWDMSDFNLIWQTIKPFIYTQLDKPDGLGGRMKVPHQNKNSEFLLLSTYAMIANKIGTSPKLKGLNRFMEDKGIDVAEFESAVKVGGQGIIDISVSEKKLQDAINKGSITVKGKEYSFTATNFSDIKEHFDKMLDSNKISQNEYNDIIEYFEPTEQEVYEMLEKATIGEDGNFKEEVVHEIPYSDYVIQQPTPEHLFDIEAVFGSQFRNLIISDLPDDMEITVNGAVIKGKKNIINLYQSLIVENLLQDYEALSGKFTTIETLQKELLNLVKGNPKYGRDMLNALRIVEHTVNGKKVKTFNIPFHNPTTFSKVQELMTSMFKNTITKQYIKGGNCVLVSDFGLTNELQILRNDDGSIKGAQCYMPFYTKKYFEPFLKDVTDKNGKVIGQEIDIEAIKEQDPDLLKIIGYRIPTEDKYSMIPLIITGFLPQQNGSSIMLPADITQIAGSDFDIDKLFLMIPEFNVNSFDKKAFENAIMSNKGFKKWGRDKVRMTIDMIINGKIAFEDNSPEEHIYNFYEEHKDEYVKPISKVRYNNDKSPEGNNRRQRNNMIIDIAYAILTHKSTAEKMNTPGNFDKPKLAARVATLTKDVNLVRTYMEIKGLNSINEAVDAILKEDLESLSDFLKTYKKERNPLVPNTFAYYHNQNMTGGALIGMYALNTTMQAKFQGTRLVIAKGNEFVINGRTIKSLHDVYTSVNGVQERISANCASFSAASVDNVKDPVLADLLQNKNTANIAGLMLRAGVSVQEIGLLFTQPLVRAWIESGFKSTKGLKRSIFTAMSTLKRMGFYFNMKKESENLKSRDFTSTELLSNILLYNEYKKGLMEGRAYNINSTYEGVKIADVIASNIRSAMLFLHIAEVAEDSKDLTQICRADSPKGGMSNSIAGMRNQVHKVTRYKEKSKHKNFHLAGIEDVIKNDFIEPSMSIEEKRGKLNGCAMPMLQAFYSLGIDFGRKIMSDYFVQLSPAVESLVNTLYQDSADYNISDDILKQFYFDYVTYSLSKTTTFGNDEHNTFDQKRDYYLYDFPKKFLDTILDPANKDIASLGVIKKLSVKEGVIIMDKSGRVTNTMKEMLMRDFETLLYMNDTARKLAVDLFLYSYYKDGLNFGPNNFGTFFSTNFLNSFPEIVNALRDMSFSTLPETFYKNFLGQFYINYASDIFPEIEEDNIKGETATGNLILSRKSVTNNNFTDKRVFRFMVMTQFTEDGTKALLYAVDPNHIGEETVVYIPVKMHEDPQGKKYNANMSVQQMAEVKVDQARVAASQRVELNNKRKSDDFDSLDEDFFDEDSFDEDSLDFDDMDFDEEDISDYEESEDLEESNYSPEEGLEEEGIIKC